jgi:prepilin-type N-terminal cleavage/methylation domain-containing protein
VKQLAAHQKQPEGQHRLPEPGGEPMTSSRHDESGFTLLEMMAVVGIFGLLLAIAVPGATGAARTAKLKGASETLAADLRLARSMATAQRRTFAVAFHPNSYSVVRVSQPTTVLTRQLPPGITCSAPDSAKFFAWGLTEAATITVTDSYRSKTVQMLATGSVSHD